MKTFEVKGTFKINQVDHSFAKMVTAKDKSNAEDQIYCLLGSDHKCARRFINIANVSEVKND